MKDASRKYIAIFVALEEERRVLIDRWSLVAPDVQPIWRGTLNNAIISVFGRDEMGRVPAAIATMQFLARESPDILLIAGIAGGFDEEGVYLGDVLIVPTIVDLATRT